MYVMKHVEWIDEPNMNALTSSPCRMKRVSMNQTWMHLHQIHMLWETCRRFATIDYCELTKMWSRWSRHVMRSCVRLDALAIDQIWPASIDLVNLQYQCQHQLISYAYLVCTCFRLVACNAGMPLLTDGLRKQELQSSKGDQRFQPGCNSCQ